MRVTIIKNENRVSVDGESHSVNLADLPATVHVVQWDGVRGEVEHNRVFCEHCGTHGKKPNDDITSLAPYQKYVDAWRVSKAADDLAAQQAADKAAQELANRQAAEAAAHAARSQG